MRNWCWWEWWFKFRVILDWIRWCSVFDYKKAEWLYQTIEAKCCNPHDDRSDIWWNLIDYIKSNYEFTMDLLKVLHWTNCLSRCFIFILSIVGMNLFGTKYFNWK